MLRLRRKSSAKWLDSSESRVGLTARCCWPFALNIVCGNAISPVTAIPVCAACTGRVSGPLFAPTSNEVVTKLQSDSSRTDSAVRISHAQPASAVSVTHVQAEKIVATRCPLGNRHDPHCTSTSAPRESATARGAPGVRPVDLAASRMGKGNETSRTDGPIGRAESRRCRRCAF